MSLKIPSNAQTPTVQPQAIASILQDSSKATAANFGADQSRAIAAGRDTQQSGLDLMEFANTRQMDLNEIDAKDRDNKYALKVNELLYGSKDGSAPGYYDLKGKAALEARPALERALKEARQKATEGAKDAVGKALKGMFDSRDQTTQSGLGRNDVAKREEAQVAADVGRLATSTDNFSKNPLDPKVREESFAIVDGVVEDQIKRQGLDEFAGEKLKRQARTALYQGGFDHLMSQKNYDEAKKLLNEAENPKSGVVSAVLDEMRDDYYARNVQDLVVTTFDIIWDPNKSLDQMKKELRAMKGVSGAVRNATVAKFRRNLNDIVQSKERARLAKEREVTKEGKEINFRIQRPLEQAKNMRTREKAREFLTQQIKVTKKHPDDLKHALAQVETHFNSRSRDAADKETASNRVLDSVVEPIASSLISAETDYKTGKFNARKVYASINSARTKDGKLLSSKQRIRLRALVKDAIGMQGSFKAIDDDVADRAQRRLDIEYTKKVRARKDASIDTMDRASSAALDASFDPADLPAEDQALIGPAGMKHLKRMYSDAVHDVPTVTDPDIMNTLMDGTPEEIQAIDFAELRGRMSADDYDDFGKQMWMSARKGGEQLQRTNHAIVLRALKDHMGEKTEGSDRAKKKHNAKYNNARRMLIQGMNALIADPNRKLQGPLSAEEAGDLIQRYFTPVVMKDILGSTTTDLIGIHQSMTEKEIADATVTWYTVKGKGSRPPRDAELANIFYAKNQAAALNNLSKVLGNSNKALPKSKALGGALFGQ